MNCLEIPEPEMANAQELTRTVDRLEERVTNHIRFFWAVVAFGFVWLGVGTGVVLSIRTDVSILSRPQKIVAAAANPTNPKNQAQAASILAASKKDSHPIPPPAIEEAGKSFVDAAPKDLGAWKVALAFASYRSSLNMPPTTRGLTLSENLYHYTIRRIADKNPPVFSFSEEALPIKQAARLYFMGEDWNSSAATGPTWIFLSGGVASVDAMDIRRVVFKDVEVHYSGQALIMDDSVFVNCSFVFDNNEPARNFSLALLSSNNVSFKTGS